MIGRKPPLSTRNPVVTLDTCNFLSALVVWVGAYSGSLYRPLLKPKGITSIPTLLLPTAYKSCLGIVPIALHIPRISTPLSSASSWSYTTCGCRIYCPAHPQPSGVRWYPTAPTQILAVAVVHHYQSGLPIPEQYFRSYIRRYTLTQPLELSSPLIDCCWLIPALDLKSEPIVGI